MPSYISTPVAILTRTLAEGGQFQQKIVVRDESSMIEICEVLKEIFISAEVMEAENFPQPASVLNQKQGKLTIIVTLHTDILTTY